MHADQDHDRWRRVTELFEAALERPPAERGAFLAASCEGDPALLAEVTSLIESHRRASDKQFIEDLALAQDPELMTDARSADSLAGRTVGSYRIERELARGGMGVVYLAEDTRLGRVVALKALPAAVADSGERRERLRREARAAALLKHPSVAVVYALEEIDGSLFIASEYIEGHSLRDEIRGGGLDQEAAAETALAIASALASAHALGIVHRDLKPDNVMRTSDGQVKVLDFGIARMLSTDPQAPTSTRITVEGAVVGTPGYMPPEQLEGRPVDARADIYSFGVLLHELITGRIPSSAALRSNERSVPPQLGAIIRRCLSNDPGARFQNGSELFAALQSAGAEGVANASTRTIQAPRSPLWWWQFHQLATAALHALLVAGLWAARDWLDSPWRTFVIFAGVAAATVDVTMRLNLVFASRVHRATLGAQRARLARPIMAADISYALVLCILAAAGAGDHDELAAILVGGIIVSLISLLVIEPATSRAAFPRSTRTPRKTPKTPRSPGR